MRLANHVLIALASAVSIVSSLFGATITGRDRKSNTSELQSHM